LGPSVRATLPKAAAAEPKAREAWNQLQRYIDVLPQAFASKSGSTVGVRAVATRSLPGLNRSIGYLCFRDKKITFITRRWFQTMAHSIPYADIHAVTSKTAFFMDQISFEDVRGHKVVFDLFRAAPSQVGAAPKTAEPAALL